MQKILDLREFEQQQAEVELGKVNAQISVFQNQLKEIAQKRFRAKSESIGAHEISFFSASQNYYRLLDKKTEYCLNEIAQLELVAEKRREVVRETMRKVKVLEKLKEKKYQEWRNVMLATEEIARDDVVTSLQAYR